MIPERFPIAICKKRTDPKYRNISVNWGELISALKNAYRTPETAAEYAKMSAEERTNIKDVGGFVCGELKDGIRRNGNVRMISVIVLDADNIKEEQNTEFLTAVKKELAGYSYIIHSTHSYTMKSPRYRIVILLAQQMLEDQYVPIARAIASRIGIEYFDPTTFQPSRLFFFPSHPCDVSFYFESNTDGAVEPNTYLEMYHNSWNTEEYKMSDREKESINKSIEKKKGADRGKVPKIVRMFNETYPIHDAIKVFLSDVYVPTSNKDRYQYITARSTAGLVIYDEYAVSFHATDPASDMQVPRDAFDLVRVHKFPDENPKVSFKRMADFAAEDPKIKEVLLEEKKKAKAELVESGCWTSLLELDSRTAKIKNTLQNAVYIIENDAALKGIAYNSLSNRVEITAALPWKTPHNHWRDTDDAQLLTYLSSNYATFSQQNVFTALAKISDDRAFDPVEQYLNNLPPWDGFKRVETLFIDYLGADDNAYVRTVTRKTLCAAVKRIFDPGCKFDHILVLVGPQGIGKSTIISKIAGQWFSDSLSMSDIRDKTGAEKLQGYWILEISELAGLRKADIESTRSFISRQNDIYRHAYGRTATEHPRKCIFIGTSNAVTGFLRDLTGNRRFWPVNVTGMGSKKPFDINQQTVDQIWAEAVLLVKNGEKLFLSQAEEEKAREIQREAMETDDREGIVKQYLDTMLPKDWEELDLVSRRAFLAGSIVGTTKKKGVIKRTCVCTAEIWCECFGKDKADLKRGASSEIIAILKKLGWEQMDKKTRNNLYGVQQHYAPPRT